MNGEKLEILRKRLDHVETAVWRAFEEGRNVLPGASDDDAGVIEAWASGVLNSVPIEVVHELESVPHTCWGNPKHEASCAGCRYRRAFRG